MNKIIFSFLVTAIAGFSTLLGIIPCILKKNKDLIIASSLAFSSGVMLSISVISLIPESLKYLTASYYLFPAFILVFIFVVMGIIISSIIDYNIEKAITKNKLYKLGIVSVIALILHNIPEGITTFISTNVDTTLGITLSLAIALHNIPEGISIAIPIYYATGNLNKAFKYTFISGFSELFGAVLAYLFIAKYVTAFFMALILGLTAGIMIHISVYELFPTSLNYDKKKTTLISFFLGIIVMLFCEIII